jgi:uncharacterized protein YjbI with pentapeptide repeats
MSGVPPGSAEDLLKRYAVGERDFQGARLPEAQLENANLAGISLMHAYLGGCTLCGSNLRGSNLRFAYLGNTDLSPASLSHADLRDADLSGAELPFASLRNANLDGASLFSASLARACLACASLQGASLEYAKTDSTDLSGTILSGATFGGGALIRTDLSSAIGLESVLHKSPSTVGTDTLVLSRGLIPDSFLRGCGLSDWEVLNAKLYNPTLAPVEIAEIQAEVFRLRAGKPIQVCAVFISYASKDVAFVDALQRQLDSRGIRSWRDVYELKAGRIEEQLTRAISLNEIVLLVLSEHSVQSDWVEFEVRKAREKEQKEGRDVLCPIALDDAWKECRWPTRLRMQLQEYHILDFRDWQDFAIFDRQFSKLITGLNLFYRSGEGL